jgi:hypothetical protein
VYLIQNLGFTTKNIEFQSVFAANSHFFGKTDGKHLWILSQNLNLFKTRKNLYTRPLCVSDLEFGLYNQEIRSFGQFFAANSYFEPKIENL